MPPTLYATERDEASGDATSPIVPFVRHGSADRTVRILHVDDDRDLVELCAEFVERIDEDVSVVPETSASAGLARLEECPFDCVVSDYEMPEMNGLEFLDAVRERYPSLPFILYTGKGSEEVASEAISRGVTDYLQKESGIHQYQVLVNRVRNAVTQYHTQQALLRAHSWYERLFEQELVGIYLIQDERLAYVNRTFAGIFGYAPEELVGESVLTIVAPGDEKRVAENVRKRERGEADTIRYDWTGITRTGEHVGITAQGGTIEHDGDLAILGVLLDARR